MLRHKEDKKKGRPDERAPGAEESSQDKVCADSKPAVSGKKKELLEKLQRVTADFANYQKRVARQAEDSLQWTKAEVIKSILPAIDDFEQALEAGKTAKDVPSLLEGFRLVHEHLLGMLSREKVEAIATKGQKFDPAIHEALMQQESADQEPGMVIAELRKGYTMNGRTLRPARVAVSKAPAEPEAVEGSSEESNNSQETGDSGEDG